MTATWLDTPRPGSVGGGPAAGVVFEQDGFDDVFDGGLFVLVELAGGVEGEAEVVVGSAFVGVEDELVGGDVQGGGESADGVEGGLAGAGFVASDLGDVELDGFGELELGESAGFAEGGEAFGEVHRECEHRRGLFSGVCLYYRIYVVYDTAHVLLDRVCGSAVPDASWDVVRGRVVGGRWSG